MFKLFRIFFKTQIKFSLNVSLSINKIEINFFNGDMITHKLIAKYNTKNNKFLLVCFFLYVFLLPRGMHHVRDATWSVMRQYFERSIFLSRNFFLCSWFSWSKIFFATHQKTKMVISALWHSMILEDAWDRWPFTPTGSTNNSTINQEIHSLDDRMGFVGHFWDENDKNLGH